MKYVAGVMLVLQLLASVPDRAASILSAVRPRFHGTERQAEFGGDLAVRQLTEMLQADDLSLVRRQRVDRLANLPDLERLLRRRRQGDQRRFRGRDSFQR